jgi:hypothetical protein
MGQSGADKIPMDSSFGTTKDFGDASFIMNVTFGYADDEPC